jgi:tRNA-specific adenosine deaminase 1
MDSSGAGTLAERVVAETLAAYAALPAHGKPAVRDNGVREWTVLASMSLTRSGPTGNESVDGSGICGSGSSGSAAEVYLISLGTGVKVLPAARLPPLGDTLHDSHAEVLARRGLRRWLLAEATRVLGGEASVWVIQDKEKFALAPGVQVWLYVSALPVSLLTHHTL